MSDFNQICKQMSELDEVGLFASLNQLVAENPADAAAALDACRAGLEIVGENFESQQYFLSDLIYAGELMIDAVAILKPALAGDSSSALGKMIICTVKGDLHDIGKNIVATMMEAAGFEVIDLGVDVAPDVIVQCAKDNDVKIIGLSAVLTMAIESMRQTVQTFAEAGIRDSVKIIIGGNPVSEPICEFVGADEWVHSPQEGVNICRKWASA